MIPNNLGGGFNFFDFYPYFLEMIQFDEHICQMGGSSTIPVTSSGP